MNMIFALNMLNKFSLFIILGNLLSLLLGVTPLEGIYYPWISAFALVIYYFKKKGSYVHYVLSILAFTPLIKSLSINEGIILLAVFSYCIYYVYTYVEEVDFHLVMGNFIKEYRIIFIAVIISLGAWGQAKVNQLAAPYILINLITYIVLLRTVRFLEYNREDKRIEKVNMSFAAGAMLFTIIISIEEVRQVLWNLIKLCYKGIFLAFFYMLSGIIYLFGDVIEAIVNKLKHLMENNNRVLDPNRPQSSAEPFRIDEETIIDYILSNPVVMFILKLMAILLITYIVYKIIKRRSGRTRNFDGFVEEKEFIKREDLKNNGGRLNRLINILKPRTDEEKIRYYYTRLLRVLVKRKVEIRESHTSLEVNHMAGGIFDKKILDEIREIYILIRYGNHKGDKATTRRFSDLIKRGEKTTPK